MVLLMDSLLLTVFHNSETGRYWIMIDGVVTVFSSFSLSCINTRLQSLIDLNRTRRVVVERFEVLTDD